VAKEAALSEGLAPLMYWVKDIIDLLIERFWNYPDLEFVWGNHKEVDPASMASINSTYVRMGIKSIDEARSELGLDPLGMPHAIFTGNGAVLIKELADDDFRHAMMGIQIGPDGKPIQQGQQPGMPGAQPGIPGQGGMPGQPMGDDGSWMPDFRAALKPEWVPDFRQALTPEWLKGIREALLADGQQQGQPGSDPTQPDIRGALGLGDREQPNIRGALGMPARNTDGLPDFHSLLGGSFKSDESMAAMNVRSAEPTSKDDERRNVVLDLGGDKGSVDDLKLKEVEKFDRPFPVTGSAPTFGQLYKRDGRAGRDADGDGLVNERERPAAAALRPARPRPHNRLGERPTNIVGVTAATTAGVGVAAAAAAIVSSLRRSTNPTVRAAGAAAAGLGAATGLLSVGLAGSAAANDVAYQRRMEAVGAKHGFTPQTRGERVKRDWVDTRKKLRSDAANYDRPIDGKPISELKLPDYKSVSGFAKATQSAFPEGTQFATKIQRGETLLLDPDGKETVTDRAIVENRFVKGGMTGRNVRSFFRHPDGELGVDHTMFTIRGEGQGAGIGKQVLKAQFDEYEKLGVFFVTVHANIDVGGYAWARFGFTPDEAGWDNLRDGLKRRIAGPKPPEPVTTGSAETNAGLARMRALLGELGVDEDKSIALSAREKRAVNKILNDPDPKAIWKLADARIGERNIGKELLMDTHWYGDIRLDDADAMARFNHYTGRSK
jgi:hypothetical protein